MEGTSGQSIFAENLKRLGNLDKIKNIQQIRFYFGAQEIGVIPNMDGKRGSLQIYEHLLNGKDGEIDSRLAIRGLELFAEHVADAEVNPGKHPNIDILLDVKYSRDILKAEFDYFN